MRIIQLLILAALTFAILGCGSNSAPDEGVSNLPEKKTGADPTKDASDKNAAANTTQPPL